MLADALPFSELSYCGCSVVLRGVEMGYIAHPVHCVYIQSKLVTGFFPVAACPALPIKGVAFLMGNDIAGGKVTPALEVLDTPECTETGQPSPMLFPSCVVTRAQTRKTVSLSDSFLMPAFSGEVGDAKETEGAAESSSAPVIAQEGNTCPNANSPDSLFLPVSA